MLVFFIHGVATQNAKYARSLESLIKEEFKKTGQSAPLCSSSFWGHFLKDVGKMWNWIEQDLQEFQKENPLADLQDLFRYQKFRKDFLFEFFGDAFTYLNSERGSKIRELIAHQLEDFIQQNPEESELHIISHSLGTVILWDILFSDKFHPDDAAFKIRAMIEGLGTSHEGRKVYLSSITTMGSPILLFNMMLGINPEEVKSLTDTYPQDKPLRWINILHSSDIIAYPLRSSLDIDLFDNFLFEDKYIPGDANKIEKNLRSFANSKHKVVEAIGLVNPLINEAIALAPMMAGAGDGHIQYWNCPETASLIASNILGETEKKQPYNPIQDVIKRLKEVPGMTCPLTPSLRLHTLQETLEEIKFKNGNGKLLFMVNPLKVYYVYLFDRDDQCIFRGYVGLIHGEGLKKEVNSIKQSFG